MRKGSNKEPLPLLRAKNTFKLIRTEDNKVNPFTPETSKHRVQRTKEVESKTFMLRHLSLSRYSTLPTIWGKLLPRTYYTLRTRQYQIQQEYHNKTLHSEWCK